MTHQPSQSAQPRTPDPPATTRGSTAVGDGAASVSTRRRVVTASFVGTFVEWFDYAAYGYLATTISQVFFPGGDGTSALLETFGVFAISFLIRPVGAFVWGRIGDRAGRRRALSLSIAIMSAATCCIALLPTYETVGVVAPALLLLARLAQGFSAAGEYAGAAVFLAEYAPRGRRGLFTAVVPASTAGGLLLGSLLVTLLTGLLSQAQLQEWGWRLPFLLAAPLGLVGRFIRLRLEDTPAFQELTERQQAASAPLSAVLRDGRGPLLRATGATVLNAVAFYVLLSYMPTYLTREAGVDAPDASLVTTVALAAYIGLVVLTGRAADRFGRQRMLAAASVLFVLCSVPAFALLPGAGLPVLISLQLLLCLLLTLNDGPLPGHLAAEFPTRVRFSGFAISFNLANALFGGTAPFVVTLLISRTGSATSPAWYLVGAALISLLAVAAGGRAARRSSPPES